MMKTSALSVFPLLGLVELVSGMTVTWNGRQVDWNACSQVLTQHAACTDRSYQEYRAAVAKGDDGRPDWAARKTCNYLDSAIDICGDGLLAHGCQNPDQVDTEKDRQIAIRLRQIKNRVTAWDSSKCPPVRRYLQRIGLLPPDSTPAPTDKCSLVQRNHEACTDRAYKEYQATWARGEDGRPDWVARKTCNYLTSSIDVCGDGDMEGGCMTQEEVDQRKDYQIGISLAQIKSTVKSWDSSKCPPVRNYLQRLGLLTESTTLLPVFSMDLGPEEEDDEIEEEEDWFFAAIAYYCWAGLTGQAERFKSAWDAFLTDWETNTNSTANQIHN